MQDQAFEFKLPTKIIFGEGAIGEIGVEAKRKNGKRLLLVIDPGVVKAGLLEKVREPLLKDGLKVVIFDEIEPEPWVETADGAGGMALKEGCDLVIGVGGGSAMDVAKAAAILATNEGKAKDYQGLNKVKKPGLLKIMVPTTAGTGSEVTFTSVLSNRPKGKAGINSPYLFPEMTILDPMLTITLPPNITASTGMDALTHAIEAYTSLKSNILTNCFALRAIELISKNLRKAFKDGKNIEARSNMLLGSLLAGIALANAGVGAVHALAYPLGGIFRIPHGIANGLMLPYVMEFNLDSGKRKYAKVAEALGERIEGLEVKEAAQRSVSAVISLIGDIKVPKRISELEVPRESFSEMAALAMKVTRPLENNPCPLTKEDTINLYQKAF